MSWDRPYFEEGGGDALVFSSVFGKFALGAPLERGRYRSSGPPAGVSIQRFERAKARERFATDDDLERELAARGALAAAVRGAPELLVVRGTVNDPETLDYLRDVIGVVAYLLDDGGVAVLDWQSLRWLSADEWRREIFAPEAFDPFRHIAFLTSAEEGGPGAIWLHTRGMRKFGRPDLSVREVPQADLDAAVSLVERLVSLQASGGAIPDGQPVRMAGLPQGMRCRRGGTLEDPDFDNVHVEIRSPAEARP